MLEQFNKIKKNIKYNKNTTLITNLSSLYNWKQHDVPEQNLK